MSAQHLQLALDLRESALQPLDLFVPVGHHPLVFPGPGAVYPVQHVQHRVYRQPDGVLYHHRLLVVKLRAQSFVFDQIHPERRPVEVSRAAGGAPAGTRAGPPAEPPLSAGTATKWRIRVSSVV